VFYSNYPIVIPGDLVLQGSTMRTSMGSKSILLGEGILPPFGLWNSFAREEQRDEEPPQNR
jgi:hypothetical protein